MGNQQTCCQQRLKRSKVLVSLVHCVMPVWDTDLMLPHKKPSPAYWRKREACGRSWGAQLITAITARHGTEATLDLSALRMQLHEHSVHVKPAEEPPSQLRTSWQIESFVVLSFRVFCYRTVNNWHTFWKELHIKELFIWKELFPNLDNETSFTWWLGYEY